MVPFLYALSFLFNFSYGVLLPLVPHLNEKDAGWAFTAFLLFKLFWFVPAGGVSDLSGHRRALSLALLSQCAALALIAYLPSYPWFGRAFEGIALAQGTLSTFALLRELTTESSDFRSSVAKLLGLGGLGMILGPYIGYALLPFGPVRAVEALGALNFLFLLLQLAFFSGKKRVTHTKKETASGAPGGALIWFALGLTAAKALAVGWEPNLAWWAKETLGFSAEVSGASFLVLGLSFVLGSLFPKNFASPLSFLGFIALEFALRGSSYFWWPACAILGYWYGMYVSVAVSRLGWTDPDRVGRHNAVWMMLTDLPMTFVPAVLWHWRTGAEAPYRWILGMTLLLTGAVSLWFGSARDSRAPTANY